MDQSFQMDRIYRYQRHVYDATRRLFLFGRDRMLKNLPIGPESHVLEVGCGTARNLLILAKRYPQTHFYGLDISAQMLRTAQKKIDRSRHRIQLARSSAEHFDARTFFSKNAPEKMDVIFFSYSLSMIPQWRESLQTAIDHLKPGGSIHIVDFWDQKEFPRWFERRLKRWLALFHVRFDPALIDYLQSWENNGHWRVRIDSIARRYAFYAQCISEIKE